MSVECYRTKGKNTYYSEGKRVSKNVASYLSPKLPKCVSKTKSKEIASLKKQLKEVLTHREEYKTTSADLDSRLKACSIVKGEYDRLVDMINSANSSVDVMNRVCLSQDLKKQIDREYRELRETLESTTRSYDEKVEQLVKIVEKNKLDIEAYQTEVLSVNEENNNLREALKENANMITGLGQQINQLQNEKVALLEELNVRERIIYDKNGEIEERMNIIGRLDRENNELKNNIKKMASDYDDLNDEFEDLKEKATMYYNEAEASEQANAALVEENDVLKQRYTNAENTKEEYINRYENDMAKADKEIRRLNAKLEAEVQKMRRFEEINLNVVSIMENKNKKLEDDNKILKDNYDKLEALSDRLDSSLALAIKKSGECFSENKELSETFSNEKFKIESSLFNVQEDNKRMREALEQTTKKAEQCEADKIILQEDINLLRNNAENLRNSLIEEKNECLERVQRAIDETEGNIGSREARKYEKELSDLNSKLRLTEEALDELRKAGTLEGEKLPAKAVKKAIKKMKQAGAKV